MGHGEEEYQNQLYEEHSKGEQTMEIKTIGVAVRKSAKFQTYECSATAETTVMDANKDLDELKSLLKAKVDRYIKEDEDCRK